MKFKAGDKVVVKKTGEVGRMIMWLCNNEQIIVYHIEIDDEVKLFKEEALRLYGETSEKHESKEVETCNIKDIIVTSQTLEQMYDLQGRELQAIKQENEALKKENAELKECNKSVMKILDSIVLKDWEQPNDK